MTKKTAKLTLLGSALAGLGLAIWFLTFPESDLIFSRLFFDEQDAFWVSDIDFFQNLRFFLWNLSEAPVYFALVMLLLNWGLKRAPLIANRVWAFVLSCYLVGPALITSLILKGYWGRARPIYVTEFGGTKDFTPPITLADQCESNCSFVSGEASVISTAALLVCFLLWRTSSRMGRLFILLLAGLMVITGALLRIAKGKHFLSDTLFAFDFMTIVVISLFLLFGMDRYLDQVSLANMGADLRANLVTLKDKITRMIFRKQP